MHADFADVHFLRTSTIELTYVLLVVDLLSQKVYTYPVKTKNNLFKAVSKLYDEITEFRKNKNYLRIHIQI